LVKKKVHPRRENPGYAYEQVVYLGPTRAILMKLAINIAEKVFKVRG